MNTQLNRHDYLIARFDEFFRFSLEDLHKSYQFEIDNYDPNVYDSPQRGARLAAATKRYRTSEMIGWMLKLSKEEKLDLTPSLFNKIAKELFNRTGNNHIVQKLLNQNGRTSKSETNNFETVNHAANKYKDEAMAFWDLVNDEVEMVKYAYQKKLAGLTTSAGAEWPPIFAPC